MTQEGRAKLLEDVLRDLAIYAGQHERSTLYPGAEVVDDSYATGRILIRGRESYYEPALRIPGYNYSDGDTVLVLYIQGAEPIALSQSPGSSGTSGTDDEAIRRSWFGI